MKTIDDIKALRGQYEENSNHPIATICDYLIDLEKANSQRIATEAATVDETVQ
jgi:hypothetical protein